MTVSRRGVLAAGTAFVTACDSVVLQEAPATTIDPITSNEDFYVYHCCGGAEPDPATWACEIRVLDVLVATIDVAWLESQVAVDFEHTLQCIGSSPRNQAISNAIFGGMRLADALEALGITPDPSVVQIHLTGDDDYDAGVPATDLEKAWLVWRMNGEPLPVLHGYPARLIIPGRYGVKNVKWIRTISFLAEPIVDYWTARGWDEASAYKVNGFILSPVYGATASRGEPLMFVGMAYAGEDPVVSVEITFDGFRTTTPCTLDYAPGTNRWVLWSYSWAPERAGTTTAQIRVTTASGAVSSEDSLGTTPLAGYDGGMAVDLNVT